MTQFYPMDIVSINSFCPYRHMYMCKTYLVLYVDKSNWNVMFFDAIPAANFGLINVVNYTPTPYLTLIERL